MIGLIRDKPGDFQIWYVRVVEEPDTPTARVVLEVLDSLNGKPDPNLAHNVRQIAVGEGC